MRTGLDFTRMWMPGAWVFALLGFGGVAWAIGTVMVVNWPPSP